MDSTPNVLGYCRVSTDEQASSGLGLAAQRKAIRDECARRGWNLAEIVSEDRGVSGKAAVRPGLDAVLRRLDTGEASILVVSKMDRLSRSLLHGASVMERARKHGWSLVALDLGIDMATPAGEMFAGMLLSTATYERRIIGERTKSALAVARANGVRLGRPGADENVVRRIAEARAEGKSFRIIAEHLEADGVLTRAGKATWHASTVRAVLESQAAQGIAS